MFILLCKFILEIINLIIVPVCLIAAWLFIVSLGLSIYSAIVDTAKQAKQMHSIPCSECSYFTNDYRLKCTIHPSKANTTEAVNCRDYLKE